MASDMGDTRSAPKTEAEYNARAARAKELDAEIARLQKERLRIAPGCPIMATAEDWEELDDLTPGGL